MTAYGDRISSSSSLATLSWRAQAEAAEERHNDAMSWTTSEALAAGASSGENGIIFVQDHYLSAVVFASHW